MKPFYLTMSRRWQVFEQLFYKKAPYFFSINQYQCKVLFFLTFLLMISTVFLICANVNPLIKIATLLTESLLRKRNQFLSHKKV
jgi:hypothetical protein